MSETAGHHIEASCSHHDSAANQSRVLLVKNVASDASEEELLNIFKVRSMFLDHTMWMIHLVNLNFWHAV